MVQASGNNKSGQVSCTKSRFEGVVIIIQVSIKILWEEQAENTTEAKTHGEEMSKVKATERMTTEKQCLQIDIPAACL